MKDYYTEWSKKYGIPREEVKMITWSLFYSNNNSIKQIEETLKCMLNLKDTAARSAEKK